MKELTKFLKDRFHFSERKACKVLEFSRSTCRYKSVAADQTDLHKRIIHHAHRHARFGYRRIHVLLMREGRLVNIKRVRRIYREESLSYRLSKRDDKDIVASSLSLRHSIITTTGRLIL